MLCAIALTMVACASSSPSVKEKRGDIYMQAGMESLSQGQYTDALAALREAVKYLPKSPEAWTNLATAYAGKEDFPRAEEAWKKALALDSDFSDAHTGLGALYLRTKRFHEAEKHLKAATKDLTYGNAYQANYNLALVYLEQRKPLLAQQHLQLALQEHEDFCPALFQLGLLQRDRGEYEKAAATLKKGTGGNCFRNPQAHYELGNLYLKVKENALAKSKMLEVIQFFPQSNWAKKAELNLSMMR